MTFIKNKENFICEHCGVPVIGNGFTNHCPKCLFSKHVDIDPGDRKESCRGMMAPFFVEKEGNEYKITHKCLKCGATKRNKVSPQDDFDSVVKIAKSFSEKK